MTGSTSGVDKSRHVSIIVRSDRADSVDGIVDVAPAAASPVSNVREDVSIRLEHTKVRRGFVETEYLHELCLTVPVTIAINVAASYLYDKLKSIRGKADVTIGKAVVKVEGISEIQATLTKILAEERETRSAG